jgi:Mu transposase-like protein
VLADCTVSYRAGSYSVPHQLVGSRVTVKADPLSDVIEIFSGAERVARHRRVGKGQRSLAEEHLANAWLIRKRQALENEV